MSICFQSDWKDEHGNLKAIPHISTKNTSFLRMGMHLKKMGISNYAFPLALYDPDLKDVNVHDLEADTEENNILRTKVIAEARRNVWYFLRECVRIYEQGGDPIHFKLDRGNLAMAWCFVNGIDYAAMQPRQAQPLSSNIMTPDGWSTMGAMKVGSLVRTPDGGISTVIGVYPQGIKDVYRITLEDGRSTNTCDDHLWKVRMRDGREDVLPLRIIITNPDNYLIPYWDGVGDKHYISISNIEQVDREEVQCILINHPDHLYITDDNIVTHNTGKTVCAVTLTAWIMYTAGYEFQIGLFTKDNNLREENVKRVKTLGENLPKWWMAEDKNLDKKNATELYYRALRTHFVTYVANPNAATADLQARGASPPVLWIDEQEYCQNIDVSYSTMLASTEKARRNAEKNGKPHSNLITTTAGDPSRKECIESAKILAGAMPFTELLYDLKDKEELHAVVKAASPQKMIIGVFSHLMLGYSNEWLREVILRNKATGDKVLRDYLNRRVSIQDTPIIPKDVLLTINKSKMDPTHIQVTKDKFVIYWYLPKDIVNSESFKQTPIIVGCDSSEMIGRDSTTLVGLDPRDMSVVFTFKCNEANLYVVGVMIAQLLLMFPKMLLVPENKSSGTGFIDTISLILRKEGHNPFKRMFNWVVNNRHEREFADIDIRNTSLLDSTTKKYFGIKTDKAKRDELYSAILLEASARAAPRIRDQNLIEELNSLTARNGRIDHAAGGHDDTVIAFLLAAFVILNGKHLDLYGISPGTTMSRIESTTDKKAKLNEARQEMIRDKIEELEKAARRQTDPSLKRLLEADIYVLREMLESVGAPLVPTHADALIRDPKKFTDQKIAEESREPVSIDTVENSLRSLLNLTNR